MSNIHIIYMNHMIVNHNAHPLLGPNCLRLWLPGDGTGFVRIAGIRFQPLGLETEADFNLTPLAPGRVIAYTRDT